MGEKKDDYDIVFHLRKDDEPIIVRDNAIESARQAVNKYLEKLIAGQYYFVVRVYPHHVIRENKMITGAGADRLQKGMRRSFGRPTDCAARIKGSTDLFTIYTYKQHEKKVEEALERAKKKLSGKWLIVRSSAAEMLKFV
jgi:large subunit ribosomal protein L10e